MLIEQAQTLSSKIEALEGKRVEAGDAKKYADRSSALREPVSRLKHLMQALELLRNRGADVTGMSADGGVRARLETITASYDVDSDSILEPDGEMRFGFWDKIRELPNLVESRIKFAWKQYVEATVFPLPAEIVEALAVGSPDWRDLNTLYQNIDSLKSDLPDSEVLAQFDKYVEQEREARVNLGAGKDIEDLEPFILAAQEGTADLSMINEDLKIRLSEMGIIGLFQVGISRNRA
jgi:hypothetical protein